ncbi:MAG: metallopeptidase [Planctomycetota bacterium]|nr:metallopeptidase [Planctomycetota bacterium]
MSRFCLTALFTWLMVFQCLAHDSMAQDSDKSKKEKFYDPVLKKIEGFEIAVDPALLKNEQKQFSERVFKSLANHLQRVEFILPRDRLKQLHNCKIWIELDNPKIRGMQYHPGRGWLLSKGLDPRLVKHVHIPQANALLDRQQWAKHPYVILHELAHSFHDQVYGFDNKEIQAVFQKAKASGKYDKIIDHRGNQVRHYGMNNEKEYFAESTEAYLGVNDFFPFVRAELREFDPGMYRLLERIWGKLR